MRMSNVNIKVCSPENPWDRQPLPYGTQVHHTNTTSGDAWGDNYDTLECIDCGYSWKVYLDEN